jgi:RNA polymerase sigma factor (sigma-70 family)
MDTAEAERLVLDNLPVIDLAVSHVARRYRLSEADRDDLASMVRLKLVDDGYAVVRRFEGRSTFRSYLVVVVQRVLLDWRAARWGKWRPSAIARRLGGLAMRLESLLYRDGRGLGEAIEVLRHEGMPEPDDELAALASRLPVRVRSREVPEEEAVATAAPGGADDVALDHEAADTAARAEAVIVSAVEELPLEDRVVLKMHFLDGCRLSDVARALQVPQKPLYKKVERSLGHLRRRLEETGLAEATIGPLLAQGRLGDHLRLVGAFPGEIPPSRPSS